MDFNGLDLNLLVVLDALLTERSVTRSSQRLHLSQSATSAALGRLRGFYKDDLFIPIGRKMVPTSRAEELISPLRDVLLRIEAITKHNSSFDPGRAVRNFRIMMSDYAATVLMPEVLPRMEQQAPGVGVEIFTELDFPIKALERGDIDLLIFPYEAAKASHHRFEALFQEDYVLIAWADNPLVTDKISLQQYLSMGHVGYRSGPQQAATLDVSVLEKLGYERRIEVFAATFNLVPELVVGTKRIATVHRRLAQKHAAFLPLRLLEPPLVIPPFTEGMHWHKSRDADPGIDWLRKIVREAAAVTHDAVVPHRR